MTLFEFCVTVALIIGAARVIHFAVKRIKFLITLLRMRKIEGVRVELSHPSVLFSPWQSKKNAAVIDVGGKRYSIRVLNGRGYIYSVHMASPEYFVNPNHM